MLSGKKVLLGVTGSIAAYKTPHLVRLLKKQNCEVKVILTPSATDFVTPLSLSTVSGNPVYSAYFNPTTGEWANHVELGLWADVFIIAPASANTLAKMAQGQADNLLLATYLSARCPVMVFPAMDLDMYRHVTVQNNIALLRAQGVTVIEPAEGELASGLTGKGRMPEPEEIVEALNQNTHEPVKGLKGKNVLITAGPTHEAIDPVRFIGNHSSGKMGIALAQAARVSGANVTLICGPVQLPLPSGITVKQVTSASEMEKAVMEHYSSMDFVLMAAAVADYKPVNTSKEKVKKKDNELSLELTRTNDILAQLVKQKKNQVLVGFALETENEIENAKEKLKRKNLDFIVLNSLKNAGAGFGHDTNQVTVITSGNKMIKFELMSKQALAFEILKLVVNEK
jgi:phosphopantothenoylcysteine decarboxylase / phosphopantothenate---cysteine ligase